MQALDELLARWRKNPDQEATVALCAHLGTSRRSELLREVGNTAEAWHRENHAVMVSVGRMYLDAGLLAEAQAAFIQSGKLAPGDAEAYRYLGEVLLRRGDAVRGEKALARAIKLGDDAAETRLWHERAIVYAGLQTRKGLRAVADEVARTAPHLPSIPAPTLSPFDPEPRAPARARRSRPPGAAARPTGPRRSSPPGPSKRRGSAQSSDEPPVAQKSAPLETLMMGRSPIPVAKKHDAPVHPPSPFVPTSSAVPPSRQRFTEQQGTRAPVQARAPAHPAAPAPVDPVEASAPSDPFRGTFPSDVSLEPSARMFDVPSAETAEPPQPSAEARSVAPPTSAAAPPSSLSSRAASAAKHRDPADDRQPSPEQVLLALASVGLYETESAVVPAWESSPRPAPRRLWVLAGALVAAAALGLAGYRQVRTLQTERVAQAQELSIKLGPLLDSGSLADLRASEEIFQRLFELDSRSPETALAWLKNRVAHSLLGDEPTSGVESALQRARTVGVEEVRLVFGRLASAVAQGDLPGAGQLIAEWDARAKEDASYQLLAGVVFERAGNPEALDRYVEATRLQPDLKLAHLLAARLALLARGAAEAKSVVDLATARLGSTVGARVLSGLAWAADPVASGPLPSQPDVEALQDLPGLLRGTAHAIAAVQAQREGRPDDAAQSFEKALGPSSTPALAAWIGYQAIGAGQLELARKAALVALQLSAQHQNAQALALRIALAEGRLEDARGAVRALDPLSRDAVLVEAASAYENLQGQKAVAVLGTLPVEPGTQSSLAALAESDKAVLGALRPDPGLLERLAQDQLVWGRLVAIDVALDHGQLDAAEALMKAPGWDPRRSTHAARQLRLRRHRGEVQGALELVPLLTDPASATPRGSAEAVLALVDADRAAAAASTLAAAEAALGDLEPWLSALVEAARGRAPSASKELARLPLPDRAAPLLLQTVALRALAATKDRRTQAYASALARKWPAHPDIQQALAPAPRR